MKNNIQYITVLALTLVLEMNFGKAMAQAPTYQFASPVKFVPPPPPPDRGAAGDRGSAASRGCATNSQSLTALVPAYEQTVNQEKRPAISVTKVWGLTTAEHSTFWFFVPHNISAIATTEFVLKDESNKPGKTIYRTLVTPPQTPGIVSIHLPSSTEPLEIGKMYHWFFKVRVKCDPQQPAQLEYVEGWVQRVSPNPSLAERLKQATPQQQVGLYAENGIWYDALTTLAELRRAKPQDATLKADWTSLLNSAGLEKLTTQPLIDCCK
ncbi:DUF928 domain-containing protein [Calothrix sp. PCC 7507]|uniref:DUF928 domain-containing protein n=1 Tax=Calothrix sp. PCC 7507 TaxID=99598 RepID=UPI00029EE743|nr:DUF928 domain-containing protein [Calothrix sp. PCC 7507]AFY34519.1 protein of unknown function DUF928 [Calothrix sp. PCC 7507]